MSRFQLNAARALRNSFPVSVPPSISSLYVPGSSAPLSSMGIVWLALQFPWMIVPLGAVTVTRPQAVEPPPLDSPWIDPRREKNAFPLATSMVTSRIDSVPAPG